MNPLLCLSRPCLARLLVAVALVVGLLPAGGAPPVAAAPGDLVVADVAGGEADGEIVVTFVRDKDDVVNAQTFALALFETDQAGENAATLDLDVSLTQSSLDFSIGEAEATVALAVPDDGRFEGVEVVDLVVSVDGVLQRHPIEIVDAFQPKLAITASTSLLAEGSSTSTLVTSDVAPDNLITLTLRTIEGTAVHGADLDALDAALTLPAGATTTAAATVATIDDDVADRYEERFQLAAFLGAPADVGPTATPVATRTMRIVDNEAYLRFARPLEQANAPELQVVVTEPNSGTVDIELPIELLYVDHPYFGIPGEIFVEVLPAAPGSAAPLAELGVDLDVGRAAFNGSTTAPMLTVTVSSDDADEPVPERIRLGLRHELFCDCGFSTMVDDVVEIVIEEASDEPEPFTFSGTLVFGDTVGESVGRATMIVRRVEPATAPADLRILTVPGSASGDIDFDSIDTVVTLDSTPSQSVDIEIDLIDDAILDDRQLETFTVQVFHVDSGRSDALTVPVIEQQFVIEDDEAPFAFDGPIYNATRPQTGTSLVEIPLRRIGPDWTLVDPVTGALEPITLTASFVNPGAAVTAGATLRQDTLVVLPDGGSSPSFLVDVAASTHTGADALALRLERTPRFSGPQNVWVDGNASLVIAPAPPPDAAVADDLRAMIEAVFDSFASWTPQFDLGTHGVPAPAPVPGVLIAPDAAGVGIELPVLDADLTSALQLSPAAALLGRLAFDEAADTLDTLLADLEANGCAIDFVADGIGGRPLAAAGDVIQATCTADASTVSPTGNSPINDAVSELYQYVIDQPRTFGNLDVSGSLDASITVGVDADGPYVTGATGLALALTADGTLVNSVDPGVEISSSGTADIDIEVGLQLARSSGERIRAEALATVIDDGLAASVSGTGSATAQMSTGALSVRAEYDATVTTTPSGVVVIDDSATFTGAATAAFPQPIGPTEITLAGVVDDDQLTLTGSLTSDSPDEPAPEIAAYVIDDLTISATLAPRTAPGIALGPLEGALRIIVNEGFEPIIVSATVALEPDRLRGTFSYSDDTADFGVFVLDRPTWTVSVDTAPPAGTPLAAISVAAERLVATLGDSTVIDATGVRGTISTSADFSLSIDDGTLGDENSALRFDIGGLTVTSPDDTGIILRADVISTPIPLLGDDTTATVRDLVVASDLRIGASSVELEQGPFGDETTVIAGLVPVEFLDVSLRFTARDADGFITDLEQFEIDVDAFVANDAFDDWPFDVVLQLGGQEIRSDTAPADRQISFSAAVDSITPLRIRPLDLGPIAIGIEGLGAPQGAIADDEVDELLRRIEERNGILQFVDVEREPQPGFGFTLDAIITLDGYVDGVLQPGFEGLVSVDYGTGLVPEQGVSLIGEVVTGADGDAGLDLQVGFLVDVDLDASDPEADGGEVDVLDVDDLEFVLSLRFGAARDDAVNPVEVEFLGVRAESIEQSFGSFFEVTATEVDLALDAATVFGSNPDAPLLTVGGSVVDSDSGARLVAGDSLGPLAGWGGQVGRFAVTTTGAIVPLDGFFVGVVVPQADDPEAGLFGLPDWLPFVLDDVAVEFGDLGIDDLPSGETLAVELLESLRLRVSGGLQSTPLFPVEATVDDLVVDVGKLVTFDPAAGFDADDFPISNLAGVRFAIQPGIDFGGVTVGGALSFGAADVPLVAFDGSTFTESVLYGRVAGYLESPVISGGVDLVLTQHGPVLAKLTAPLGIPLGPTGFVLTDVTGAATFGDVQIDAPDLGAPEQLLGELDGNLPTDVEITADSIAAAIAPSVQLGRPTWDDGFALAVSGTMSNIAAGGLAAGEVTLAVAVGAPEPGQLVPGVQAIGFGELEVFGIPLTDSIELSGEVGRAGIMVDVTDIDAPRIDLAFETPSLGSPIGLIFPARATVAGQLDLAGVTTGARAAIRAFADAAGPAFEAALEQFLIDNPSSVLALAIADSSGVTPFERLDALLDRDPAAAVAGTLSIVSENFGFVGETLDTMRTGARSTLLAADAEFDPALSFVGAVQPVLLGIPMGDPEAEVKITIDKDNISFGATGSLIEALKDQVGLYTLSGDLAGGLFALSTLNATDRLTFDVQIPVPDLRSVLADGGRLDHLDPATTSTQFAVQVEGDLTVAGMTMSVGGLYSAPDNARFLDALVQRRFELPADAPVDPDRVQVTRAEDWDSLIERGGLLLYGRLQVPRLITDPVGVAGGLPEIPADAFGLLQWFDDFGDSVTATDEPMSATLFVPGLPALTGSATADEQAIESWMDAVSFTGVFDGTARAAGGERVARLLSVPIGTGRMTATTEGLEITADVPLAGTEATFVARVEERTEFDRRRGRVAALVPVAALTASTKSSVAIESALDAIGLPGIWRPSPSATLQIEGYTPGFGRTSGSGVRRRGGVVATVEVNAGRALESAQATIEIVPGETSIGTLDFTAQLDVRSARIPGLRLSDLTVELAKRGASVAGEISGVVDLALPGVSTTPQPFAAGLAVDGDFVIGIDQQVDVLGSTLDVDATLAVTSGRLSATGSATGQLSIGALDLASGTFEVALVDGLLRLNVPASDPINVDVFGVATAAVSGSVRSDGAYDLAGAFTTIGALGGVAWVGDVDVRLGTGGTVDGDFDGRVTVGGLAADTTGTVTRLATGQGRVDGDVRVDLDGDGDFDGAFSLAGGQIPETVPFEFLIGPPLPPDIVPPVFGSVDDISVTLVEGSNNVPVEYESPVAIDDRDGTITATCTPGSGLVVSPGDLDRTVTCTATDAAGNTATTSFTIDISIENIVIDTPQLQPPVIIIDAPPSDDPPPPPPSLPGVPTPRRSGRGFVFSTPQLLGDIEVRKDGSLTFRAELPQLAPGQHHIALYTDDRVAQRSQLIVPIVIGRDGELVEVAGSDVGPTLPTPVPPSNLPATGQDANGLLRLAIAMLVVGVALGIAARRGGRWSFGVPQWVARRVR